MGSVAVDTMAGSTLAAESKKLHPFFTAPRTLPQDTKASSSTPGDHNLADPLNSDAHQEMADQTQDLEGIIPKRKRRKTADEVDQDWEDKKKPKRGRKKSSQHGPSIMSHFTKVNDEGKEAQLSNHLSAVDEDIPAEETQNTEASTAALQTSDDDSHTSGAQPDDESLNRGDDSGTRRPLKKMLQLNPKTGTIGSPPKPKELKTPKQTKKLDGATEERKTQVRRGRKRSSRIANINYGIDDAARKRIGAKIDEILNSPASSSPGRKKRTSMSLREAKPAPNNESYTSDQAPKKETHPFFTGKPKETATPKAPIPSPADALSSKPHSAPSRPRIFTSTPCSPKKPRAVGPTKAFPQFGVKSLGLKTPGARFPAWPAKDMVHVRGRNDVHMDLSSTLGSILPARKSKGNTTHVAPTEMLLQGVAKKLQIPEALDAVRNIDTENFLPAPPELRQPQKTFESGVKLEKRILRELKNTKHPALAHLRTLLVTTLSAFDRYRCESTSWAQKYTPKSAVEVLQHGREPFLLRDWLQALKVQSVDTGDGKLKSTKPAKKKRRKNKLDSFIVDSDEEDDEMDEVSDDEDGWSPDRRGIKKTVIRAGDSLARDSRNPSRLTNAVVISGPYGCGKTSAVYAIAKELDFEVFEINAGNRRSGKDVLEKIGDMTRNHLVQHQQNEAPATAIDEDEVAEDIKAGKQATMNAFFKPKATAKPAKAKRPAKRETPTTVAVNSESKKAAKSQKQSLILLDEIDILYDEDKQFWSTVFTLIAQSKRPFIMTCNDENLVPLQALNLHGIFRFSAPPADLAVDRLLLIAACEGHGLSRNAVAGLYDARQQDMRACLMDLNYWCQIAVGDRRGGMEWFYPRWPQGCDIDEDGNVVRVISRDTYQEGMGWLAHDVLAGETDEREMEEELLRQARDYWQMDVGDWHRSLDLRSWAADKSRNTSKQDRLAILEEYDGFTEAMSLGDLSSATAFASSRTEVIDCTLPGVTNEARDDYILGLQLLDAPVASTYDPMTTSLPISLRRLAREQLERCTAGPACSGPGVVDEKSVVSKIRQHVTASSEPPFGRDDFSNAFDVLAASDKSNTGSSSLEASVLDSTLHNVAVDISPYIRGIVSYDNELQKQRLKLSNLTSKGGTKRMRNTRASHAALEGGSRSTTRPERWFKTDLNSVLVMQTGGEGWSQALKSEMTGSEAGSVSASSSNAKKRGRRIISDDDSSVEASNSPGSSADDMDRE